MERTNINGKEFTVEELNNIINSSKNKSVLRWPNGAIMEVPEGVEEIFEVGTLRGNQLADDEYERIFCFHSVSINSYAGKDVKICDNYFLTREEAKKEAEMRNVRAKLLRKIAEIDRDWKPNTREQVRFLGLDLDDNTVKQYYSTFLKTTNIGMSEKVADYMFSDEVDEKERRLFLGIKD